MNNNKISKQIDTLRLKKLKKTQISVVLTSIVSCCFFISTSSHASDIEIYRQGSAGGDSTIMLMVDLSQSMGADAIADLQRDYPLCLSGNLLEGVKGVLGNVATVNINLLNLVKVNTGTTPDSGYCDIPALLITQILEGVDGITNPILGADLLGLKGSVQYIKDSCEPIKDPTLGIIQSYRCYNRLRRIKQAVVDVIDGNPAKGIEPLSANISVGVSVFPATKAGGGKNELAGMIAVEAKKLDTTQREKIKTTIANLSSADPVGSITGSLRTLVNQLLAVNVLGAVDTIGVLLRNLGGNLNSLLGLSTPTATAYAETGAYLLSTTTKGTGSKEFGRVVNFSILSTRFYKCSDSNIDIYGKCLDWGTPETIVLGIGSYPSWYKNKEYDWSPGGGLLGDLLAGVLGGEKIFYKYDDTLKTISPYSGFDQSTAVSKSSVDSNLYNGPSLNTASQCGGHGLYVLTGSIPDLNQNLLGWLAGSQREPLSNISNPVQKLMTRSLNSSNTAVFNCGSVPAGWANGSASATWSCIANYAGALKDENYQNKNKAVSIKTAVGGIGRDFAHIPSAKTVSDLGTITAPKTVLSTVLNLVQGLLGVVDTLLQPLGAVLKLLGLDLNLTQTLDQLKKALGNIVPMPLPADDTANLARWGVYGGGGWYQLSDTKSISESIIDFSQHLVETKSDAFLGLQTIPADPLTPYQLSSEVYNSIFIPSDKQSWNGNLKKYSVLTENETSGGSIIRLKGSVDFKDQWNGGHTEKADGSELLIGGALDQLKTLRPQQVDSSTRQLWINRDCQKNSDKKYTFNESKTLKKINVDSQYLADSSVARCSLSATEKDPYAGYLMNLLGYKVDPLTATGNELAQSEPFWQLGMPLHSTPLKITQFAKFQTNGTIDRDDYIVFGSTQGLLHIVDASTGKEKFAFVPNEMLEDSEQRKAFTRDLGLGWKNMPYGIDGAWTAYTEYVYGMKDGKVQATVGQIETGTNKPQGKQVLYGGLRMGGQSYYALNLQDITSPSLKFHIDPKNQKIINASGVTTVTALQYMGQSWSKPTLAYVNWQGQRKQVMFVGGGYDTGYEIKDYNPATATKGAGVYMFDANNGDLLWWGGANAINKNDAVKENSLKIDTMQFSVVSRINVADRNGDGLVDHLYFGDLGGQVWRVDLNPVMNTSGKDFAIRATRLLNLHKADGSSPRFYDAPSFSIYGYEKPLAVLSIASGNRSLPATDTSSGAIYNIFDQDVTRTDLYASTFSALTTDLDLTTAGQSLGSLLTTEDVKDKSVEQVKALIPNGWAISFDQGKKVMDEMAVINKNLYASVYNPGETPTCPVQVRGETQVHRYCLPFGVCEQKLQTGQANNFLAGKGIIALNVGAAGTDSNTKLQSRGLIQSGSSSSNVTPVSQMRRQLVPLKWYENNE
ncbi:MULTISPECIES: PilC/PilY family type IV pilus protein [Acinetobacter]|uniref:PilC/PilY family type IV pilus protein n=1 Tax=Acinetobacter TaxID=469 RepID=UPI001F4A5E2B|nr:MULTISPECIES: PilC/PilY family type IV pilus protein [Acinetobacter]MCH7379653.1 hypothetical protein [Acinetobacter higginsii]